MELPLSLLITIAGYLIGSLSFARLVARWATPGADLTSTMVKIEGASRDFELKTISATSISARSGPRAGCLTSLLDMAKAGLPALWLKLTYPETPAYFLLFAFMVVIGHNYPLFHRLRGGRGLSPIFGGYLIIDWIALPVTILASNIIGLGLLRDFMFGYSGWLLLLIPWMWWRFDDPAYVLYAVGVAAAYYIASIPEIKLYLNFKREGEFEKAGSLLAAFEHTDVGRPLKYMRKYGLLKDKKIDAVKGAENHDL